MVIMVILAFFMVISVSHQSFRYFGSYSDISVIPVILVYRRTVFDVVPSSGLGNGSFRSYSRSDPGSFRSYSLSVRSFRPDFRGGSFRPNFGGSFRPTLFYLDFYVLKVIPASLG